MREHRLYQADWLIRFYGFNASEITTPDDPFLDLKTDPKTQWARRHPEAFPVDVNAAPREAILRVPGLGYQNVDRILRIRRYHRLALEDLRQLHVSIKTVSPWIVATDHLPSKSIELERAPAARQLSLDFIPNPQATAASTIHGQL